MRKTIGFKRIALKEQLPRNNLLDYFFKVEGELHSSSTAQREQKEQRWQNQKRLTT